MKNIMHAASIFICLVLSASSAVAENLDKIAFSKDATSSQIFERLSKYFRISKTASVILRINNKYDLAYEAPAMDAYSKNPWHKYVDKSHQNSQYCILDLKLDNGIWYDVGSKIAIKDPVSWSKKTTSTKEKKLICLVITLGEGEKPFANIDQFKKLVALCQGRFLFRKELTQPERVQERGK